MNKKLLFLLLLCYSPLLRAQDYTLIPYPNRLSGNGNTILIEGPLTFSLPVDLALDADVLLSQAKAYGIDLKAKKKSGSIRFKKDNRLGREAYTLHVSSKGITIRYADRSGAFYAMQTLNQLIRKKENGYTIPQVEIDDRPAFSWRAYMLDESRHFQGMETVKILLDEMARLKFNTFHWHLVDDPGWRIEISQYPDLTRIGSKKDFSNREMSPEEWAEKHPGRHYYTQDEIREIIAYADARCITIVPEIEMPGHASASILAYPQLGTLSKASGKGVWGDIYNVTDPQVEVFLQNVLTEIIDLFPSRIIHIGGDEVAHSHWENTPEVAAFMKARRLPTAKDLQIWFINRISEFLQSKGCTMMGWNEITGDNVHGETVASQSENLAGGTVVHFWDGDIGLVNRSIERGYKVVNSNRFFTYLDYPYEVTPLEKAYSFSPIPEGLAEKDTPNIWGLGCQMWGEFTPNRERVFVMTFPRIAAHAETGWTLPENKNYSRFLKNKQPLETVWTQRGIPFQECR